MIEPAKSYPELLKLLETIRGDGFTQTYALAIEQSCFDENGATYSLVVNALSRLYERELDCLGKLLLQIVVQGLSYGDAVYMQLCLRRAGRRVTAMRMAAGSRLLHDQEREQLVNELERNLSNIYRNLKAELRRQDGGYMAQDALRELKRILCLKENSANG